MLWAIREGATGSPGLAPVGTGFEPLDTVLDGGILPGELLILGGQPGVGKTSVALQWARNICLSGRRATFACFEHDELTLTTRLLIQELATTPGLVDPTERHQLRRVVRNLLLGLISPKDAVASAPRVAELLTAAERYSNQLQLFRPSAQQTSPQELIANCETHLTAGSVLFVDYIQKLPVKGTSNFEERVFKAVEMLKELAISRQIGVVALSAAYRDRTNLDRVRLADLQGSDSLANECDIALLINEKSRMISSRHAAFDSTRIEQDRRRGVISVEKNRRGEVNVHLEFNKDLSHFRFDPAGGFISEPIEP